jgi:hypothetical protein
VQFSATSISEWLDAVDGSGGALGSKVTRMLGDATYTVPAARRTVTVAAAPSSVGPVVAGAVLPPGEQITFVSDYPGYQLPEIIIATVAPDDVLVTETWVGSAEPPPDDGDYLLLEGVGGGVLLLENGDRLLLEP